MHALRQAFRFLTVVLTAITLGLTLGHLLEMPAKLALTPGDYVIVQRIYSGFGVLGALVEPAAIICAFAFAFLARGTRAFRPAVVGALCLVAALLIWVAIVNPTNAQWQTASPSMIPPDFEALRMRWEWGHAVRAALVLAGFASLVIAVLADMSSVAAAAVKLTVPTATTKNGEAGKNAA